MMSESNISGSDIIKLDSSPQTYYGTSSVTNLTLK